MPETPFDFQESLLSLFKSLEVQNKKSASKYAQGFIPAKEIPGSKQFIPAILEFAKTRTLKAQINGISVGEILISDILFMPDGIKLVGESNYSYWSKLIPYLVPELKALHKGSWVDFGSVQIKLKGLSVFPKIQSFNTHAKFLFEEKIQVRPSKTPRIFKKLLTNSLSSISVYPEFGTVECSGLIGVLVPDLIWR